jgi:hypothetical protein
MTHTVAPEWIAAEEHNSQFKGFALSLNRIVPFFTRHGVEAQSTVYANGKKRYCLEDRACTRCGGFGGSEVWKRTDFVCYKCHGTGGKHIAKVTVYTAEQLAKLNARQDAKLAAKQAAQKAQEEAAVAAFNEAYPDIVAKLAQIPAPSGFVQDVVDKGRKYGFLSDRQRDALNAALDRELVRKEQNAVSQHAGTVGERIEFTGTITFTTQFQGAFGTVYVTGICDDAGNIFIQKGKYLGYKGERLIVTATVKEHGERDGVKQTIITRPKVASVA